MIIFAVTTLDQPGKTHCFSYGFDDLEADLNLIDAIAATGHSLLRVQLIDRSKVIDLPVETFNNVPACTTLDQLKSEWEAILAN